VPELLGPIQPFRSIRFCSLALACPHFCRQHRWHVRGSPGFELARCSQDWPAHSVLSLEVFWFRRNRPYPYGCGHFSGWPIIRAGAQTLTDALARHLESLGGCIETSGEVTQLPDTDLILADVTPRQLLRIAGSALPSTYRRQLEEISIRSWHV